MLNVTTHFVSKEAALRETAWHAWYKNWVNEPLAKRSRGDDALPEGYFVSAANHIRESLLLDSEEDIVLDVGCDSGLVSRFVIPHCRYFVGLDYIPELLPCAAVEKVSTASGARLVAGDGRRLPFRSRVFTKVYCSDVLHSLPSHEDALLMIEELVRVCRPGGRVFVTSIPDICKRFRVYAEVWEAASLPGKLRLALSLMVPLRVKKALQRLLDLKPASYLVSVTYNLLELKRRLEAEGLRCQVMDYAADFWSRSYRNTRTNLLIHVPPGVRPGPNSYREAGSSERLIGGSQGL